MRILNDRAQIIQTLEAKYTSAIEGIIDQLSHASFYFSSQYDLHIDRLNVELVRRHALPYCITESIYGNLDESACQYAAQIIMLHTLSLTSIDDYYDGGADVNKNSKVLSVDDIAHSLSLTHVATNNLIRMSKSRKELVAMLDVTTFTHGRMYQDHYERYDEAKLDVTHEDIRNYIMSDHSRIFASGYWEVMTRGVFARNGIHFPKYLQRLDRHLRRLRQLIDELYDTEEDVCAGLVTLPLLYALKESNAGVDLKKEVKQTWESGVCTDKLLDALRTSRPALYRLIEEEYHLAQKILRNYFHESDDGYGMLFDFKYAKYQAQVL